jgi:hypothetical protein
MRSCLPGITSTGVKLLEAAYNSWTAEGCGTGGSAIHGAGHFSTVTRAQYGNGINGCPCR